MDNLGDRMKMYEQQKAGERFLPLLPVCIRLDGKCFHDWTRGLKRPFDFYFHRLMKDTTRWLIKETNAIIGYTASDEISLILYSDQYDSQIFFGGKIQKIISIVTSLATAFFNTMAKNIFPEKGYALFDCRAWQVPNKEEAVNVLLWRELDATKNSISMAARTVYSHNQLFGKTGKEMQELLYQKGINWNLYPDSFKRGSYIQKKVLVSKLSSEELDKLPPKHSARKNPEMEIKRTIIDYVKLPPLNTITNKIDVIFNGDEPKTEKLT